MTLVPFQREGWTTSKFKYLFRKVSRATRQDDGIVTAFRDGVVTLRSKRRDDGYTFAEKEIGYQGVEPGDLVIHAMDGFAGAIGVSDSRGKVSPVLSILTPIKEADPNYWAFFLRNLAITGFISSLAKGIRERSTDFRWKDAGNLVVNYPPPEQQREISAFLNAEMKKFDDIVSALGGREALARASDDSLLGLLRERRSALITAAVTGQIDVTTYSRTATPDRQLDAIQEEVGT